MASYWITRLRLHRDTCLIDSVFVCFCCFSRHISECLAKLCLGEADLERFLFFNPLFNDIESNNNYILENDLNNAKTYLNEVVQKFDKDVSFNWHHLLMFSFLVRNKSHSCIRES